MKRRPFIHSFLLKSLAILSAWRSARCSNEFRIHNARELISFSNYVNSGTSYEGTTVYLDSDIDFAEEEKVLSQQFNPINNFRGTFNGQGHVIRNFAINSSNQDTGLFGYSYGTTIRNVVLDESCSIMSSFTSYSDQAFTGGIIGYCGTSYGPCIIENCVNMAEVSFTGNTSQIAFTGGIAGVLALINNDNAIIMNCANYGTIKDSGISGTANIGGIAGSPQGGSSSASSSYVYVQNCANYGSVIYNGTTNLLIIGGISGYSLSSTIENCVTSGEISIASQNNVALFIGSIVGYSGLSEIIHCYWISGMSYDKVCGYEEYSSVTDSPSYNPSTFELNESVSVGNYTGTSLIEALIAAADYYALRGYSNWALNKNSLNVSFTVNEVKLSFTANAQVILLPDPASEEGTAFDGWYTDSECTKPLAEFTIDSVDETDLHGLWRENTNNYTIFFDTRGGGEISPITSPFGSVVTLPTNTKKERYEFVKWETEQGYPIPTILTVPARNTTLYAVWLCTHITTAGELISFSESVNSGTTYEGTTVYLDSDIDFAEEEKALSQQFEPIGRDANVHFRGSFNGQGYAFRNLAINSSNQCTGLFGHSYGTTIRNVVIDESCSVVSRFASDSDQTFTGSIICYCNTNYGNCIIENCVNMAEVSFTGSTNQTAFTGGIVGRLVLTDNENAIIMNCANYGTVKDTGISGIASIGGIVGSPQRSSSSTSISYTYIQNCANYGSVIYKGTGNALRIGGISGLSYISTIENCVSSGTIVVDSQGINETHTGGVIGSDTFSIITHCFWTRDVNCSNSVGSPIGSTITSTSYIEQLNKATLDELNDNVKSEWSKWTMLHFNGGKINNLTQSDLVVAQSHFPYPVKEGNSFVHWCTDYECNGVYSPTQGTAGITDLYAKWAANNYSVRFSFLNGTTTEPVNVTYGEPYGTLPESNVTGHSLCWFTLEEEGWMKVTSDTIVTISSDHTLYGRWIPNNYTATFVIGNGTVIEKIFTFNETVNYPGEIEKKGYIFAGWDRSITEMPAENITVTALWIPSNYTATFVLGNGTVIEKIFTFNETVNYPGEIEKKGYIFAGWDRSITEMPAENIIVTALWTPNNYTATFVLENNAKIEKTFAFNETVKYPEGIEKEGCTLSGLNKDLNLMPAENITIAISWKCASKSSTSAIVGGAVGGIVLIVVAVLVVLLIFFAFKKREEEGTKRYRIEMMRRNNPRVNERSSYAQMDDDNRNDDAPFVSVGDAIAEFYPERHKVPTIAEALRSAGLDSELTECAVETCALAAESSAKKGKLFEGFTEEDAAAVALYTFDFGGNGYDSNPYRIINSALVTGDAAELERASGLLYLIMSSLRRLPRYTGRTLYRGIREGVRVESYREGRTVVWRGFSSTSPDMAATKAFLAKDSESGNAEGTLFIIEGGWGYDVQPYSLFPKEAEILLEPERQFRVVSVIKGDGLTIINLQMVDTPIMLPEIFGGGSE